MPEDLDYFVEVKNPVELRKGLLEASKKTITVLKSYEEIKKIRAEKKEMVEQLDSEMKEIILLFGKLKSELPKVKHPVPMELKKIFSPVTGVSAKPIAKPTRLDRVDRLEAELKDIEAELEKLA